MKQRRIALLTSLLLLLSLLMAGNVGAHTVIVVDPNTSQADSSRGEWFDEAFKLDPTDSRSGAAPDAGYGLIARNAVGKGEFIFSDPSNDQRVISTTAQITTSTDLQWFATTGDTEYVSFLVKTGRIKAISGDPPPELMISISTDQDGGGGKVLLPDTVGVTLTQDAAWEYVIQTDFTKNSGGNTRPPKLWKSSAASAGTCQGCEAQLVGSSNGTAAGNFIELKVPWSNFSGGQPTPAKFWRFTVTSYYKGHDLSVLPSDGFPNSALIDAVSAKSNADILASGALDSYFDVHYDADGEVFSPLLISEFSPNPTGVEPAGPSGKGTEWIEIVNVSDFSVQLGDYKIGDATKRGSSSEGMLQFPSKTLAAGGVVIAAQDTAIAPINEITSTLHPTLYSWAPNSGSPDLQPYTPWSTATKIGLDNVRDQLVLLDGRDTIVDLVEYTTEGNANPPFIGHVPYTYALGGTPEGNEYSLERCPAAQDTNSALADFQPHTANSPPTPGEACPPETGVDLTIAQAATAPAVLAGQDVSFSIVWRNDGTGSFSAIQITDTLPLSMTFKSSSPAAQVSGQNLTWDYTNLTGSISGTIVLTATVAADAPANTPLLNTAGVRSADDTRPEASAKLDNNLATAAITVIKPDLAVSSTWPGGALPGDSVDYVISYANNGTGIASDVVLSDTLPAGATFISSTLAPDASSTATEKRWLFDQLSPGESGTIGVRVQISGATNDQLTNALAISGTPADDAGAASQDNSETRILVVGIVPNLTVDTSGWPATAAPGTQFCFDITYAYPKGALQASDVVIEDTLPPGLSLVSQTSSANLPFNGASTDALTWGPSTLDVDAGGTITVCVRVRSIVPVGEEITNTVSISGSVDPDPSAGDNIVTQTLTFDPYRLHMPLLVR